MGKTTISVEKDVYDRFGRAVEEKHGRRYGLIKDEAEKALKQRADELEIEARANDGEVVFDDDGELVEPDWKGGEGAEPRTAKASGSANGSAPTPPTSQEVTG